MKEKLLFSVYTVDDRIELRVSKDAKIDGPTLVGFLEMVKLDLIQSMIGPENEPEEELQVTSSMYLGNNKFEA